MMIKRYCDCCGIEITERTAAGFGHERERIHAEIIKGGVKLKVEVIQSVDGCANAGDVCKYCILDALQAADDRPKPEPQ